MFYVVSITALSCPVGAGILNGSQCEVSGPTPSMCLPGMTEDGANLGASV